MKRKDLKKLSILIGVMSFILGSFCAYVAYKVQNNMSREEVPLSEADRTPASIEQDPGPSLVVNDQASPSAQPSGIDLHKVIDKAQESYSTAEKNAKEGLLWVDQETGNNVITLGAINGLAKGSELSVLENGKPIGKVRVSILFDSISYVAADDPSVQFTPKVYYKVLIP